LLRFPSGLVLFVQVYAEFAAEQCYVDSAVGPTANTVSDCDHFFATDESIFSTLVGFFWMRNLDAESVKSVVLAF